MSVTADILSLLPRRTTSRAASWRPASAASDRYKAAMVANAMAITLRAGGDGWADAEQSGLVALYPEHART